MERHIHVDQRIAVQRCDRSVASAVRHTTAAELVHERELPAPVVAPPRFDDDDQIEIRKRIDRAACGRCRRAQPRTVNGGADHAGMVAESWHRLREKGLDVTRQATVTAASGIDRLADGVFYWSVGV